MTATEPGQPLTDAELAEIERETRSLFAFGDTDYHIEHNFMRLLAEVDRLRAENTAQAAKLAAVWDVITPKDPDWKPLTERYPEYFPPETPEEAARKNGWRQGVELLTDRLRAALDQSGEGQGNA